MTLRLELQIDGNSSSAVSAANDTTRALDQTGAAAARQGQAADRSGQQNEQQAKRVKDVAEQLQFEAMQLARNSEQQAVHNALRRAGVTLMSTEGQAIARLAQANDNARVAKERAERASLANNETIEKLGRVASVAGGQVGGLVGQVGGLVVGTGRLGPVVAGVTLGIALLVAGVAKSTTAYAALEKQQQQTALTLQATNAASGQSVASIETIVQRLARAGTQQTDELRAGAQELLRYREVGSASFERTLTNAQKLANLGFLPLKESVAAFGQAARDPVNGLQALEDGGLKFAASQRETIRRLNESGQSLQAYNEVQRIAEQQFGDTAKGPATLAASFGRLRNEIKTDFELLGELIVRWTGLRQLVSNVADTVGGAASNGAGAGPTYIGRVTPATGKPSLDPQTRESVDQVTNALNRQTQAARLNEVAQAQLAARQLAGVDAEKSQNAAVAEAAALINRKVSALHAEAFMQQARAGFITQSSALKVEGETLDWSAGKAAAYRYEQEKLADAKARGITLGDAAIAELKREADAVGSLTQNTANLRLQRELTFERAQLGRSSTEARVAQDLRSAGIDANSAEGARLAEIIRVNEALKTSKELLTDFASGFAKDFRSQLADGANAWETFKNAGVNALGRLEDKLIDMAVNNLVAKALGGVTGGGGIFGALGGLFGGGGAAGASAGGIAGGGSALAGAGGLFAAADGGTFGGGRWGIVGERGWELMQTHAGGGVSIYPHEQSKQMIGGRSLPGFANGGFLPPPVAPGMPASSAPVVHVHPAAPNETFDAKIGNDGSIVLVGRMINDALDDFSRRHLPGRVAEIQHDPWGR